MHSVRLIAQRVDVRSTTPFFGLIILTSLSSVAPGQLVDHVLHISVDGLHSGQLQTLIANQPDEFPNFARLAAESVSTFNARTDATSPYTLPNHTSMMTGRPVHQAGDDPTQHHGHDDNATPAPTRTLHTGNPSVPYIASTFDIAHDYGRSTALYTTKSKFVLYEQSYNATDMTTGGRPDAYLANGDQGTDKIDRYVFRLENSSSSAMIQTLIEDSASTPFDYALVHFYEPDDAGHTFGWQGERYQQSIKAVDSQLGTIFDWVETHEQLKNNTAMIVTSDHGGSLYGHDDIMDPNIFQIPFFVWGPGIPQGYDLYALNPLTRTDPGRNQVAYTDPAQPIRNADSANLALALLGLPPIDGSSINDGQDLRVELPVLVTWNGTSAAHGEAGDGTAWKDARNWTRHAADQQPIAGDIVRLSANPMATSIDSIDLGGQRRLHALEVRGDYRMHNGSLEILTGTIEVDGGRTLTVAGSVTTPRSIIKSGPGTLSVESPDGQTSVVSDLLISQGRMAGEFRVAGQVANAGILAPGTSQRVGTILISNDFTQNGAGTLEMKIAAEGHDQVVVQDLMIYRGLLDLRSLGDDALPTDPRDVQSWELIQSGRRINRFPRVNLDGQAWTFLENTDSVQLAHLGHGRFGRLDYAPDSMSLTLYQTVPGDVDGDGAFGTQDLVAVFSKGGYENGVAGDADWMSGDWNNDSDFTTADLVVALSQAGFEQPSFLPASANEGQLVARNVPEPQGVTLLGFALTGIMTAVWRSRTAMRSANGGV